MFEGALTDSLEIPQTASRKLKRHSVKKAQNGRGLELEEVLERGISKVTQPVPGTVGIPHGLRCPTAGNDQRDPGRLTPGVMRASPIALNATKNFCFLKQVRDICFKENIKSARKENGFFFLALSGRRDRIIIVYGGKTRYLELQIQA